MPQDRSAYLSVVLIVSIGGASVVHAQAGLTPRNPPLLGPDLQVTAVAFQEARYAGPCNRVIVTIQNSGKSPTSAPVIVRLQTHVSGIAGGGVDGAIASTRLALHRGIVQHRAGVERILAQIDLQLGLPLRENPFFRPHEGIAGATTRIGGREVVNYGSYNYLGLNGDPRVIAAARAAMDRHGVSASASRMVSGERPVHGELEAALAAHYGVDAALALVSGHATNVTVLGAIAHDPQLALVEEAWASPVLAPGEADPKARLQVPAVLGGEITFLGYRLSASRVEPGDELVLSTFWRVEAQAEDPQLSLFAHLWRRRKSCCFGLKRPLALAKFGFGAIATASFKP